MKRLAAVVLALGFGGVLRADEKALAELAGMYEVVGLSKDGKAAPANLLAGAGVTVASDGGMVVTVRGKSYPSKLKVDPKATPAAIDISPTDGPEKGRTFPGVYKLGKGELVIAFAEKPGAARPADTAGNGGETVMRLKKAEGK